VNLIIYLIKFNLWIIWWCVI